MIISNTQTKKQPSEEVLYNLVNKLKSIPDRSFYKPNN